jgi:hypothetical protein
MALGYERGDRVKDRISGFSGIIMVISVWLNGCVRIGVRGEGLDKDGNPKLIEVFDIAEIEMVQKGAYDALVAAEGVDIDKLIDMIAATETATEAATLPLVAAATVGGPCDDAVALLRY